MDILNEIEKREIEKFLENPTLKEGIKKFLLNQFDLNRILTGNIFGLTNENLGEVTKSVLLAQDRTKNAFLELEKLKRVEKITKNNNLNAR